jgi:CheY-like chemotaxis protein
MSSRSRILVIDDSAAARASIVAVLQDADYLTFELASAIGATRTIMRDRIVGVVADISMPGLSGDKLVGVLRKNPRFVHLGIILVSGREDEELKTFQEHEVDGVLSKRDIQTHLAAMLARALRRRGLENTGS